MTTSIIYNKISKKIQKNINGYHQYFPELTLRGEYWESVLNKSLIELGYTTQWDPFSHKQEEDIFCEPFNRISVKSGVQAPRKKTLKINGSRTTKFKTLDEKLRHLSIKRADCIFSLSYSKVNKNYDFIILDVDDIKYNALNWHEDEKNGNFVGVSPKLNIKIVRAMSDQVWYEFSYDLIKYRKTIVINDE